MAEVGHAEGRSEHELRILDAVVDFFDRNDIEWWLDQGSALGAVRDGCFLPWDHDIDTSLLARVFEPHRSAFVHAMHMDGYRVRQTDFVVQVSRGGTPVDVRLYFDDRDIVRCHFRHLPPPGTRRWMVRFFWAVPLGVAQRAIESVARRIVPSVQPGRSLRRSLYGRVVSLSALVQRVKLTPHVQTEFAVPAATFATTEVVSVSGRRLPVPANCEAYLAMKYGEDWRTPKRERVYWRDDGALQAAEADGER